MSKLLLLIAFVTSLVAIACSKRPEMARPTERNLQRQQQEDVRQKDLMQKDMDYRETKEMSPPERDNQQTFEEEEDSD